MIVGLGLGLTPAAGAPLYLGQVATRTIVPNNRNTTNKQMMARRWHFARDSITSLQVVVPNWIIQSLSGAGVSYTQNGQEAGLGGTATVTGSIEYPEGVFTALTFGTATDFANLVSSPATVSIPTGAIFWTRLFWTSATGIVFTTTLNLSNLLDPARGDGFEYAASGVTDKTMGGTVSVSGSNNTLAFGPAAIIAQTRKGSVLILGDSRATGLLDTPDADGDLGEIARSIGPSLGYINASSSSDRAVWCAATNARRKELAAYCSHVVIEHGTNDLVNASRTAAQVKADLESIGSQFGKPWYQSTIVTRSTSTDSWATVVNQTPVASEAQRVSLNTSIRAGLIGARGYFEVADAVESARDSGRWKATGLAFGYTADGTHENRAGYLLIKESGAISPSAFVR